MRRLTRLLFPLVALLLLLPTAAFAAGIPQSNVAPLNPDFVKARKAGFSGGVVPDPVDLSSYAGVRIAPMVRTYASSFDLRKQGRVSSVKDQHPYGTCWTFATFASMESCLLKAGQKWDFSEDNLAYWHGFDPPYPNGGGNNSMAVATLARWWGPFSESQDRYGDGKHTDPTRFLMPQKHLQNVLFLPPRAEGNALDNDNIKYALTTYGAVAANMMWSNNYYNATTAAYYNPVNDGGGHAVTIVGWDDNYSATNFSATPPGNGAFLVKNSWGTRWGQSGYFWISYYDGEIARRGITAVYYGAESASNYTTLYYYDRFGWCTEYSPTAGASPTAWMANAFTAEANQTLNAVSFYATGPNTSYKIYAGSSLGSRTLRASGTTAMGYRTIKFSKPLSLKAGQKFYVIVQVTTPAGSDGRSWPIAIEYPRAGYSSKAIASSGHSYASSDGEGWSDISKDGADCCIKAFTRIPGLAVGNSIPSKKTVSYKSTLTLRGVIKPRHQVGSYPVLLYMYRYSQGKWVLVKTFTPRVESASTTYSRYATSIRMDYKGKIRFRARYWSYVGCVAPWSSGYTYVTVK